MAILAPSVETIKKIHDFFIEQYGIGGYMSEGMVEGCLERAMTYIHAGFKPFPTLFLKAAALIQSIIVFHPFIDGNKRTAFETTRLFLLLNGYELTASSEEGVSFTKGIADGKITKVEEIAEWLMAHSKRRLLYMVLSFFLKFVISYFSTVTKERLEELPESIPVLLRAIRIYPD